MRYSIMTSNCPGEGSTSFCIYSKPFSFTYLFVYFMLPYRNEMKLRLLIIHRFRKALKRSSIKFIFQPFALTKLLITGTRRICSRGFWNRSRRWGVGSWGGGKLTGSRTKGRCCRNFNAKLTNTHVSQRYYQATNYLRWCSWCFETDVSFVRCSDDVSFSWN